MLRPANGVILAMVLNGIVNFFIVYDIHPIGFLNNIFFDKKQLKWYHSFRKTSSILKI